MELFIIVGLSLLLVPVAMLTSGIFRIALGLVFILFSPGYTLIAALFPRKSAMSGIERAFFSIGLSIAVIIFICLILNYTPWGIKLEPVLLSVLTFILAIATLALYRRYRLVPEERFEVRFKAIIPHLTLNWRNQSLWEKVLAGLLILAVVASIGTLIHVTQTPKVDERFTEFYILGLDGKAEDYPQEIVLGRQARVILEIINHEQEPTVYNLEIEINGQQLEKMGPIALDHKAMWQQEVAFTPINAGLSQKVEFQLYRGEASAPYHTLHLWIDVVER